MSRMIFQLVGLFFVCLFGCNQCGSDGYSFDIEEVSEEGSVTNPPSYNSYGSYDESILLEVSCDEGMTTEGGYLSVRCLNSDQIHPERFICEEGIVKFGDAGSENDYNTDCVLYTCEEEPGIGNCDTFEGGPV